MAKRNLQPEPEPRLAPVVGTISVDKPGPITPSRYAGDIARDYSISTQELERHVDEWQDRLRREVETRGFVTGATGFGHAKAALALVLRRQREGRIE
jgi:hypothetical protein